MWAESDILHAHRFLAGLLQLKLRLLQLNIQVLPNNTIIPNNIQGYLNQPMLQNICYDLKMPFLWFYDHRLIAKKRVYSLKTNNLTNSMR